MADADELGRLRARVAELEAQAQAAQDGTRPWSARWTSLISAFVLTMACLLAPLSVASVWARSILADTERYVETVSPLAENPAVRSAITEQVTSAIMAHLDVEEVTADALTALAGQPNIPARVAEALPGLAIPLTLGVESFVQSQVRRLVDSPRFAELWDEVNRAAHVQVLQLLKGNRGGAVSAQDGVVTLNLGPVIEQAKALLVEQGFALAAQVPTVDRSFVLVKSDAVVRAQRVYALLNTLGQWPPFVAVVMFVAGVYLARERRRALFRGSLGVTLAMVILGVGLTLARVLYVETAPADMLTRSGAASVYDTLARFLRDSVRATATCGLLVALAAFLTGPSRGAVQIRSSARRVVGSLRGSAESAGWKTGRVGIWVDTQATGLRVGTFIAAGLTLIMWSRPNVAVVVTVGAVTAIAFLVIEFLRRTAEPAAVSAMRIDGDTPPVSERNLPPAERPS